MTTDKKTIARILEDVGTLLELKGENPFKSRAYHNVSRIVEGLTADIGELVRSGDIEEVKGIGKGIAEKIAEIVETGSLKYYEELRASLPPGVPEMLRVQGLGPKKIKVLYEKLKIHSIDELLEAAAAGRLRDVEGFGEKTEQNILKGIQLLKASGGRYLISEALESAERIHASIKSLPAVKRSELAGSLRRRKETIGDIDIVVSAGAKDTAQIMGAFVAHAEVKEILAKGETKSSVALKSGIQCDLRIVRDNEFPFALNYFTGSKEHNVEMRSRARSKGWSLNEYGFSRIEGKEGKTGKAPPACKTEADIYRALGLSYVPPELRENVREFDAAAGHGIPALVELSDLKGTFHCHTTYSDGINSIEEMVEAARKLRWEYLGIADHSQVAAYARGLTPDRVRKQLKEIDALNDQLSKFRIFKGTEVDIMGDGSLDFSDRILSGFDYVVASIHSKFKMTQAEATQRLIRALKNKYVTMLGHPTGRLLLSREGYPVDAIEVINAAADLGKSIEINAHPTRLDLDWRMVYHAREKGVPICINPDAHITEGLLDVKYGIGIARKGWLEAKHVVNTWSAGKVEKFFTRTRS